MKVKDLFHISKGKKAVESSNGVRYIQIEDLRNDKNLKYTVISKAAVTCTKDDILIAWDGANAGTIGYNLEGVLGSTLAKLTPIKNNTFPPYVGRFLQSKFNYLRSNCTGATIPHISRKSLENLEIPLPPLPIQQKIAHILDQADQLVQLNRQLIEKYEQLAQSLFLEMFGDPVRNEKSWEKISIENLIENVKKLNSKSNVKAIEYVDISSINNKSHVIQDTTFYKFPERPSRAQQILEEGDILLSTVRPNLKNIAKVIKPNLIGSTGFFVFRPKKEKCTSFFIYELLKTNFLTDEFMKLTSGANYPAIKNSVLIKYKIICPPIELQNQFAEKIQNIEKQKAFAVESLKKSEELFQSLLQKAFKGELVKEENVELV